MTTTARICSESVFLVSGGARGVTAQCVMKLAQSSQCKFILLGRSAISGQEPEWAQGCEDEAELKKRVMQVLIAQGEKPTPMGVQKVFNQIIGQREIQATLAAIRQAGSRVEYISVDITNKIELQQAISDITQRLGTITGIIHGAGNLADKLIEKKTERDFEIVYAAKVQGLENLLSCIPINQLQHLVLFSSVAGFYGNAGQSDYALANEILNKSAHLIKQQHSDCHVVSINWGPWDSGMVTPELKRAFAQRNIAVIPLDVGAQMLVNELAEKNQNDAQVVIGSPITPAAAPANPKLSSYRIRRCLSLAANPFLHDYVTGDCPVLPATVAASWLINTCEQRYPGYRFRRLERFNVLEGIIFDESQPHEFVVDVQETAKLESGEIVSEVLIWSELHRDQVDVHYRGQVTIAPPFGSLTSPSDPSPLPTYAGADLATTATSGQLLYPGILFQGRSFQGLQQVLNISSERITLHCIAPKLSAAQKGQFVVKTFDPYIADSVYQAIAVWMRQSHRGVGLPSEFELVEQFMSLTAGESYYLSVEIQSATETSIIANAIAHDIEGKIYFRFSNIKIVITQQLNRAFASSVGYIT
ncbi:MAG: SDR family NAD(P)-dependent oxidoreductase [Leptolyngbya sp. IPPAS B-1204]|nr:MAG: SDR family NAD(P)-dependent oxidoreductase [Leptolyngbya sp. IPPAS B-1204]